MPKYDFNGVDINNETQTGTDITVGKTVVGTASWNSTKYYTYTVCKAFYSNAPTNPDPVYMVCNSPYPHYDHTSESTDYNNSGNGNSITSNGKEIKLYYDSTMLPSNRLTELHIFEDHLYRFNTESNTNTSQSIGFTTLNTTSSLLSSNQVSWQVLL